MGSLVKNVPIRFAWISASLAVVCAVSAWLASGIVRELVISLFGTFGGLAVGLFVVNIYIDRNSRKVAAFPLALLIETAVNRLHNDYFIGIAHSKFGSTKFSSMIDDFIAAGREPTAFSPEDRASLKDMLLSHKEQIKIAIQDVDQRFSTLITVLGWSFDAQVVAAALEAKRNASEFIAALDSDDPDQEYRLIKHWFDVDATANSTRRFLAEILGFEEPV